MQLVKQNLGSHWVIGIKGKTAEIEQFHNRIYNWGGTNGELHWMSDSFAYFWITMEKLERCMFKYVMNSVSDKIGNRFKNKKGGLKNYVINRVQNTINSIPVDNFFKTKQEQDFYSIGTISAEKLDEDS